MKRPRVRLGVAGLAVGLVGGALVAYELTVYRLDPAARVDVGPSSAVEVPPDVTTIDVSGRTVMPGLIDLHVHLGSPELDAAKGRA